MITPYSPRLDPKAVYDNLTAEEKTRTSQDNVKDVLHCLQRIEREYEMDDWDR